MATYLQRPGPGGKRVWQAQVRRRGYPALIRTFDTKGEAETWAVTLESEIKRGVYVSRTEAENTTLAEALERYGREVTPHKKSAQDEAYKLKRWKESRLARRSLASIQGKDLATWRDAEIARGSSPATVRRKLALLSHVFEIARKEWGMASLANPVGAIRQPSSGQGRDRRLRVGEEAMLLKAAEKYGKDRGAGEIEAIIRFALETAMRRGEIAAMRWEHVDRRARVLSVPETKNGDPRRVPLSTAALAVLEGLPRQISGEVWSMRPDSISQAFDRVVAAARQDYEAKCKKARKVPDDGFLTGLRLHDLRHEATSRLFEKGLNPMQVASITGHKTLQMLKRYTHLRAEDLVALLG